MAAISEIREGLNLTAFDTERIIPSLKKFKLGDVGGTKWFKQHEILETLNIQVEITDDKSDEIIGA